MRFISTRGQSPAVDFIDVLLGGPAPDGGLYMPEEWPRILILPTRLYTDYVFPFELAAVVLLVAMIAAIGLTLRSRKETKYQDPRAALGASGRPAEDRPASCRRRGRRLRRAGRLPRRRDRLRPYRARLLVRQAQGRLAVRHGTGLRRVNSSQLVVGGEWHKLDYNIRDHGPIGLEAVAQ